MIIKDEQGKKHDMKKVLVLYIFILGTSHLRTTLNC